MLMLLGEARMVIAAKCKLYPRCYCTFVLAITWPAYCDLYRDGFYFQRHAESREHHTAGFNNLRAHTVLCSNLSVSSQNIAKNIVKM